MANLIIETFWLLLPAGIANMSPVLFKWVPVLQTPVDFGRKFRNKPVFGRNKTYRGLLFGILAAILTVWLQKIIGLPSLVDYAAINVIILGALLGGGALAGDLVKSFLKRQRGIKPGKQWVPFDQLDWIIGALIFVSFYIPLSLTQVITGLILFGILHPIINLIGYALKIKKNKF